MRCVHDAVEDGIGECSLSDAPVPVVHGQLTSREKGLALVASLDDLEDIPALLGRGALQSPVVEQQQIEPLHAPEQPSVARRPARLGAIRHEVWNAAIEHGHPLRAGLMRESAQQKGLADASWPGNT